MFEVKLYYFFNLLFMSLTQSQDLGGEFNILTWVDFNFFFFTVFSSCFFVFRFYLSILGWLRIEFCNFFQFFSIELSWSYRFIFFPFDFNLKHWICWKWSFVKILFVFYEVILDSWPGHGFNRLIWLALLFF